MTENEIVQYLKGNKNEGRILSFMPEEVQKWCEEHEKELLVWSSDRWYEPDADGIYIDATVALPDDYKVKKEPKSGWVEFEIHQESRDFLVKAETENHNDCDEYYCWFEVERFLRDSIEHDRKYTAFGGYYYGIEPIPRWYMSECVTPTDCNGSIYTSYTDGDKNIKPLTPKKIRFWREKK